MVFNLTRRKLKIDNEPQRSAPAARGMTLIESLTVLVVMGIVIFVTLPHLTQSKAANELSAAKAKAVQLNYAKDSYLSINGLDAAQTIWKSPPNNIVAGQTDTPDERLYNLIKYYLPTGTAATALNTADANAAQNATAYAVPGYTYSFFMSGSPTPNLITDAVMLADPNGNLIAY
jgi:prepilin-type N-terminal cleavage/methylation domain-containing protein